MEQGTRRLMLIGHKDRHGMHIITAQPMPRPTMREKVARLLNDLFPSEAADRRSAARWVLHVPKQRKTTGTAA